MYHALTGPGNAMKGEFARKQLGSASRLIAWSHAARFRAGLQLAGSVKPQRVLDYGCGDATFLALLMESGVAPAFAHGAETSEAFLAANRHRFRERGNLSFVHVCELKRAEFKQAFDCVICMEVLEHVLDRCALLEEFAQFLKPGGCLLVSVPVEIGLSVILKQSMRRISGWRGIGDYPGTTSYSWGELARAVFAGSATRINRPIHRNPDGTLFHDHKGFNWRLFGEEISKRFEVRAIRFSPVSWLPAFCASQVWFKAMQRDSHEQGP
jgi:SAM-dependent methyltransferase